MRAAAVQLQSTPDSDRNLETADRLTRAAKWHQSGSAIGHDDGAGQGASIWAPPSSNSSRIDRINVKPAVLPGSITIMAVRAAAHMRVATAAPNSPARR